MDAPPVSGRALLLFLRRIRKNTMAPMSASPAMGPMTAPAIQAFEPDPPLEGSEDCVGVVPDAAVRRDEAVMVVSI